MKRIEQLTESMIDRVIHVRFNRLCDRLEKSGVEDPEINILNEFIEKYIEDHEMENKKYI